MLVDGKMECSDMVAVLLGRIWDGKAIRRPRGPQGVRLE